MIKINTSHILPDVPYLLEGTESSDVLGLPPDAIPPLVPAGDITYRLSAVMAGADLVVTGSASVPILTSCARCLDDVRTVIAVTTMLSVPVSAETCERKYGTPGSIAAYHRHIFQLVGALSH